MWAGKVSKKLFCVILFLTVLSHQCIYKLYQIYPENCFKGNEFVRIVKVVLCTDNFLSICLCVWNLSSAPLRAICLLCFYGP